MIKFNVSVEKDKFRITGVRNFITSEGKTRYYVELPKQVSHKARKAFAKAIKLDSYQTQTGMGLVFDEKDMARLAARRANKYIRLMNNDPHIEELLEQEKWVYLEF